MRANLFFVALLLAGCCNQQPQPVKVTVVNSDSLQYKILADTIVCDMVVRNPYDDDKITGAWLGRFNHKQFIDSLFDDLYAGHLAAFDFITGKQLTKGELKDIEKASDYNREIVGKFQFSEQWQYDRANHVMIKKVHAITFGYETYDQDKLVRGYKPMFKVYLNGK
jgi:hypothetical protein